MCCSCEDIARQSCAMVPIRWRFLATFLGPAFAASSVQHISDLCRSMVEIPSVAAEIRRGKKDDRKIEITGKKYNGPLLHRAAIKSDRNSSSAQRYDGNSTIHDNRLPYNKHILQISSLYEFCPGFTNDNFYLL